MWPEGFLEEKVQNKMKDHTGIDYLDDQWPGWTERVIAHLEQNGISKDMDYGLGYHQGVPTIYWGQRAACIYDDLKYLDSNLLDEMRETLTCATKEAVMAEAEKVIEETKKTKDDLAKFIHTDVSLSSLTTFERDQIIDKISVMFNIK